MKIVIGDKKQIAVDAAASGAKAIRKAIETSGMSTIVLATGASQFDVLARLVQEPDIDCSKVTAFHLDEYLGLAITHKASFRKYLHERFVVPLAGGVDFIRNFSYSPCPTHVRPQAPPGKIRDRSLIECGGDVWSFDGERC